MNKNKLIYHLNTSINKKIRISNLNFISRFIEKPLMFLQTIWCHFLRFFNLIIFTKTKTFWGQKMLVVLPEVVSSELFRFGFIEESVAKAIITYVSKNDVVIDVGAHFGFFSLLMSEIVETKGEVHSFEPIPSTFKILEKNTKNNKNLFINQIAIWNNSTILHLNDYGLSSSAFNSLRDTRDDRYSNKIKTKKINVNSINLDKYVEMKKILPKFIKIDAESTEYEVLLGMSYILKNIKPIICLEIGDLGVEGAKKSIEAIKLILSYGYKVYEFQNGRFSLHKIKEKYNYGNLIFEFAL